MSVSEFIVDIELDKIEVLVKTPGFFTNITNYINNLIVNFNSLFYEQIEYNREIEIKKLLIIEIKQIFKNFNKLLNKYFALKPDSTILIDLDFQWYASDRMLVDMEQTRTFTPQTPNNKIMSKVLTINCKLIDFLDDVYIIQIKSLKNKIKYMWLALEQKKNSISTNQYDYAKSILDATIVKINSIIDIVKKEYRDIHTQSKLIRSYFLSKVDFIEYLSTVPSSIFNIFNSSLYFIEEDKEFLNFAVQQKAWLPSEIRCEYLKKILGLMEKQGLDPEILMILHSFNPNPVTIVDDIITLYWKSKNDPDTISYIYMLQTLISQCKTKINLYTIDIQKLILLTSVELELISKLDKTQLGLEQKIYESICYLVLDNIDHLVQSTPEIFNCYLIYQIPNVLLKLFDETFENPNVYQIINNIFSTHMSSKFGIYYLSSMIEDTKLLKLQTLLTEDKAFKLVKWYKIYKYINDNVYDSDILDPLTSTVLVIPSVFPMSADNNIYNVGICDKYIFEAYLWIKNENPFTRSELTISTFEEFNSQLVLTEKINEINAKLKEYVKQASC